MESIAPHAARKTRATQISDFLYEITKSDRNSSEKKLAKKASDNLNGCANYLKFHDYFTIGKQKLVAAHTCKQHMLCPFCASRRAGKTVKAYEEKINTIVTGHSDLIPAMITFTVKNRSDISSVFPHLKRSFQRLMQRRRINKSQGTHSTEMSKVQGAFASYEFTYSEDTGWHPHIHMVALLSSYVDVKKLSQEWLEITGDSMIVDVRKISSKKDKNTKKIDQNGLIDGLLEVCKYALKFSDLPDEKLWEAYKFLKGKRLSASYGNLRGVEIPESLIDDPLEDLPYIWRIFVYVRNQAKYRELDKITASIYYPELVPDEDQVKMEYEDVPPSSSRNKFRSIEAANECFNMKQR